MVPFGWLGSISRWDFLEENLKVCQKLPQNKHTPRQHWKNISCYVVCAFFFTVTVVTGVCDECLLVKGCVFFNFTFKIVLKMMCVFFTCVMFKRDICLYVGCLPAARAVSVGWCNVKLCVV